ncbi:MAG: alpha-amylase [Rhodospirillales bacterium]|nr:alpha-amylase [Rhodospirillales bacterium]
MTNRTMIQYFHWDYPADGRLWDEVARSAADLACAGITALWLPPPNKAQGGAVDVGYGCYDLFDLGDFDQKGTVRTKYGTRDQLLAARAAAREAGLAIYIDTVFNHKGGADATEVVTATPVSHENRNIEIGPPRDIEAWTRFTFPGRGDAHSSFKWHWQHFDAVDYDQRTGDRSIFRLRDKTFETQVDHERGNFDYLLFCDLDMDSDEVRNELFAWGDWIMSTLDVDGFRFDAAKHIRFFFFSEWLDRARALRPDRSLFAVGEYLSGDLATLRYFIEQTGRRMTLFDFPLHFNMRTASRANGGFDMRLIFDNTLVAADPEMAVTFVDNHDTFQLGGGEPVADSFRAQAYALILLRAAGYPCLFYPDFRANDARAPLQPLLDTLLAARRDFAYGAQTDYIDDPDVIGWTRGGDAEHPRALAVVLTDGPAGVKRMATSRPNRTFRELTGVSAETVTTDGEGWGTFSCPAGAVAVWVEDAQS